MKIKGFTLAEVLITLAIIGVVAALTIPSVIVNTQQAEFKTGLKKAVSVLNQAITTSQALDGVTPYDVYMDVQDVIDMQKMLADKDGVDTNGHVQLWEILTAHMSIMSKSISYTETTKTNNDGDADTAKYGNIAFYTTDGMRFEFPYTAEDKTLKLHESGEEIEIDLTARVNSEPNGARCGSYGLASNPNGTTSKPCVIMVDVNGDRKPNPKNPEYIKTDGKGYETMKHEPYTYAMPGDKKITDIFTILITESKAIPFGVAAQKAMYQARDKK